MNSLSLLGALVLLLANVLFIGGKKMKKIILGGLLLVLCLSFSVNAANQKITELNAATEMTSDDFLPIVDAPGGAAETKKITRANFLKNLTFTGVTTIDASIKASSNISLARNTVDGSDDGYLAITSGGDLSDARGSLLVAYGNEHATLPGVLLLEGGNVATGKIRFDAGGTVVATLTASGINTTGITTSTSFSTGDVALKFKLLTGTLSTGGNTIAHGCSSNIRGVSFSAGTTTFTALSNSSLIGAVSYDSTNINVTVNSDLNNSTYRIIVWYI